MSTLTGIALRLWSRPTDPLCARVAGMSLWWIVLLPFGASLLATVLPTRARNWESLLAGAVAVTVADLSGATATDVFAITISELNDDPTSPTLTLRRAGTISPSGAIPVIVDWTEGAEAQQGRPTYRVECWRSFAQYVLGFLNEAAREFER